MYSDINRQLEEASQGICRFQKINSMLEELTKQKNALTEKVSNLKEILNKEDIDVEKLEEKSMAHIFYSVLGNLEEKLDKERQEALAARLKYDQAVRDLDDINNEISKLLNERIQFRDCSKTYNNLYNQKKELLMQSNSETADRILKISEQILFLKNHKKEISEAINAGINVLGHLDNASQSLDSAEGWGTWDLLGGGLISDLAKHSHIDDAEGEVEAAEKAMLRFRTELADVRITNNISIETGGFAKFADFFFDGLIADWCMQSRIHDSQNSVYETKNQVNQVLSRLRSLDKEEENQIEQLEREMDALVVQSE